MMERFAAGIDDDRAREGTLIALRGTGAFRRFKDAVHSLGLADAWYTFRERAYGDLARTWCEAHGVEHADA